MNLPGRLLQILTLRCEGASELASQSLDEPLGLAERLALRGHLFVCVPCRRFRQQLRLLRDAHRREPAPSESSESLSPEAKARMVAAVRDAIAEDRGTGDVGHP